MIIIYNHNPVILPHMEETRSLMIKLERMGFKIADNETPAEKTYAMWECINKNWGDGDMLILGQDNVFSLVTMMNMLKCEYPICANPCLMFPESTGRKGIFQNMISWGKMHRFDSKRQFCTGIVGTGFIKIADSVQHRIKELTKFHWQSMDSTMSRDFHNHGYDQFHLHYPIHKHNKRGWSHLENWQELNKELYEDHTITRS